MSLFLGIANALGFLGRLIPSTRIFDAPLRTSLAMARGQGTATFLRSSIATVVDFYSRVVSVKTGESRFGRVRRVHNLLPAVSELPTAGVGGWSVIAGTTLVSGVVSCLDFDTPARTVVANVEGGRKYMLSADLQHISGETLWELRGVAGTAYVTYPEGSSITLSADKKRYATIIVCAASGTVRLGLMVNDYTPGVALIDRIQLEDVTGIPREIASEYVSTGMLTSPWHGANTDGVKNFDYWCLNTIDWVSHVVTEASPGATFGRRVENLITNSNDVQATGWSTTGAVTRTGPNTLSFSGGSIGTLLHTYTGRVGRTYRVSLTLSCASGTFPALVGIDGVSQALTLTTTPLRYTALLTTVSTSSFFVSSDTPYPAGVITIGSIDVSDVTDQVNQNPNEPVENSTATMAFPYHGTGLPGVKEFSTTNPNTVSGVLVVPNGAATAQITPGKGAQREESSINYLTRSSPDNFWTATNTAVVQSTVYGARLYPWVVVDVWSNNPVSGEHAVAYAVTAAVGTNVIWLDAYPGVVEYIFVTEELSAGAARTSYFALVGAGSFSAAAGHTCSITPLKNSQGFLCSIAITDGDGVAGDIKIGHATSAMNTTTTTSAMNTGFSVGHIQVEPRAAPSSHIKTSGTTVSRAADSLTYAVTGNIADGSGTVIATVESAYPAFTSGVLRRVIGFDNITSVVIGQSATSTVFTAKGAADTAVASGAISSFAVPHKVATRWGAGVYDMIVDGGSPGGASAFTGWGAPTTIKIGESSVADTLENSMFIKDMKFYSDALPTAKTQALTL